MLSNGNVIAVLPVSDISTARSFYEDALGLKAVDESSQRVIYQSGGTELEIFESPGAGTNEATAASWSVDDLDAVVADLTSKGVVFERYDGMPGVSREGDIHYWEELDKKNVWFRDPDGNYLCASSKQ